VSTAREDILNRVRTAQQMVADLPISREYRRTGSLEAEDRLHLLIDRLLDYDATVHRCEASQIPLSVAGILRANGKSGLLIPPGLPPGWLPSGFDFVKDDLLSYEDIDSSQGVLTGCAGAIALTGTIVLRHSAGEGRRALTLIPDYHLCVVFEDQVVETVAQGIDNLATFATHPITTVSGPSATADIEMTRVKGVHGPRTLEVLLVAGSRLP
jgi:L-lactate dehydrogenase complex protein LldG